MKVVLNKYFDIRKGEGYTVTLMFLYIFLIVASLMILKPVRNSLFLVNFGAGKLPYVFVLVAIFSAFTSFLRFKLDKNKTLNYQILVTLSLSIVSLFVFWMLFRSGYQHGWLFWGFYVWVSIFGAVTAVQFWILANYIFNAREAKRLFGLIGAGAISGGIFGGYLTRYLAQRLRTENLLVFCLIFVFLCILILLLVWARTTEKRRLETVYTRKGYREFPATEGAIKSIINSRHLLLLAGLIWVGVCVGNLADYQFNAIASEAIKETDRLTAFFGFWLSNLNVLSLLVQLFLTGRIIKSTGIGASLFFLPLGLLAGTAAVLFNPAIWSAVFIKVSDGAFKHSIYKAGTEILYLPVPRDIKNKAKTFIDVVVKNVATGFAGIFLIVLTIGLHLSVSHVGIINIVLIGLWIFLIVNIKKEYINSFRQAILKRTIDLSDQSLNIEDASVFENITKVLDGDNDRQIVYVLGLLEDVRNPRLVPHLKTLLHHASNEITATALRMLRKHDEYDLSEDVRTFVDAADQNVVIEAITYICSRAENTADALESFLNHENFGVQDAALLCAARVSAKNKNLRKTLDIKVLIEEKYRAFRSLDPDDNRASAFLANIARAIGEANDQRLHPYLAAMFNNVKYPAVVKAAVSSAGQTGNMEFVPFLVRHLKTKSVRKYARTSLAEYGDRVVSTLAEYLENPMETMRIRVSIPRVLFEIGSQNSVTALESNLHQEHLSLRYAIIKALNKLRATRNDLKFDKALIEKSIRREIENYQTGMVLLREQRAVLRRLTVSISHESQGGPAIKARQLLTRTLEERLEYTFERIFRLLGLKYDPKDMHDAFLGITSKNSRLRANAIEFLDNVLDKTLKNFVIPIVDTGGDPSREEDARRLFRNASYSGDDSIDLLFESADSWIKVCTMYVIAEAMLTNYKDRIAPLQTSPNPLIRETARYSLNKLERSTPC